MRDLFSDDVVEIWRAQGICANVSCIQKDLGQRHGSI